VSKKKRLEKQKAPKNNKNISENLRKPPDIGRSLVQWTVREMDHEYSGLWDWELKSNEAYKVLGYLEELSQKTWGEVEQERTGKKDRHRKHHSMLVSELCKEARDRLKERFQNEELPEELYRFRLAGKVRLWGIRSQTTFKLIWFDRNHKVYPV
jgi:hypothetical protein